VLVLSDILILSHVLVLSDILSLKIMSEAINLINFGSFGRVEIKYFQIKKKLMTRLF